MEFMLRIGLNRLDLLWVWNVAEETLAAHVTRTGHT